MRRSLHRPSTRFSLFLAADALSRSASALLGWNRAGDRRLLLGAALVLLTSLLSTSLVSSTAAAQADLSVELPLIGETTFSLTNTTIVRFRGSDYDLNPHDDDFFSLYERLDLVLQADELRVEARIDSFVPQQVFLDSPCVIEGDSRCYLDWDLRPERLALRWSPGDWNIEAGDAQLVFGRGVALSFRKVDLLGIDTSLRGGHVRYTGSNVQVGLHGGVANPQNQDPIDLSIIREPTDIVGGATGRITIPGSVPVHIGGHALHIAFEDDETSPYQNRHVSVAGWSVEAPALLEGQLALYGEVNGMRRGFNLGDEGRVTSGRGIYGSAQLQLDNLTLLVEWKDYDNFLVAPSTTEGQAWRIYNASPAVEFDGPQRLRGIGNQRGGGMRLDYAFAPGPWILSLNSVAYGFHEDPAHDAWDGWLVSHSWARLQKRAEYGEGLNWSFDLTAGGRFEYLMHSPDDSNFGPGDLDRWMIHGRAELTLASGDHSFDITVEHRHERELRGETAAEFQVGGATLTYSFGVPFTLSVALRWTDFQAGVTERRAARAYNFLGGEFYPGLEARVTFEPGTYLGLFVGQTPGGQICSGGVCRDAPPFEGGRLTFVGRL